ncbi:Tm-1-like ATP-binding domain-containing protein [Desulfonema magnum]|uniref:Tm-1-like ATP-binding domain-containing protein n=1 Tax=Desulfonema magnum TaxID=45655 RepID=UPI001A9A778B
MTKTHLGYTLIISTLDTKGKETLYLKDRIQNLGLTPLLMDISMRKGTAASFRTDISPDRVASVGGSSFEAMPEGPVFPRLYPHAV